MAQTKQLLVLHFNDVYNIADNDLEPVSGASRLAGLVRAAGGCGRSPVQCLHLTPTG